MTTSMPGLIPDASWPVVPRAMHQRALDENVRLTEENARLRARPLVEQPELRAENAALRARIAELEARPLVAVVEGTPCEECAKLRKRLERVRELLKSKLNEKEVERS